MTRKRQLYLGLLFGLALLAKPSAFLAAGFFIATAILFLLGLPVGKKAFTEAAAGADPPQLNWSTLKYVFGQLGGQMPRKGHKPEEIVAKLRQVDVLVSQGQTVADAVRAIGGKVISGKNTSCTLTRFVIALFRETVTAAHIAAMR
jgi:hypothetical protein